MWPRDPKFGLLYRGFRYNGVCYNGVFLPIQITVILLGPKKILRYYGDFVISGFHCNGNLISLKCNSIRIYNNISN